ncbi:acetylglutamate kinase [Buchnera aphidicola]|uniref:acetylglutamate kinase n=1 Tax=Buchnera aphidicola TaxID=9 RepID=UPI003464B1C1
MRNILVIKLGGVLLDNRNSMIRLFKALVDYRSIDNHRHLVIIHGAGSLIDRLMNQLSLTIKKKNGVQITSSETIDLIVGASAGTANKILLAWSKKFNIHAVGLCLADGNSIEVKPVNQMDLECIGVPMPGSAIFLKKLLSDNILPIISSIGITEKGKLMNVNADLAATALAVMLKADLIFLSDISSILDGKGKRIKVITPSIANVLIKKDIITDGMVVKVNAAIEAARLLGHSVDIASWQDSERLISLFNGISIGTRVFY